MVSGGKYVIALAYHIAVTVVVVALPACAKYSHADRLAAWIRPKKGRKQ